MKCLTAALVMLAVIGAVTPPVRAQAVRDTRLEWRTVRTRHFEVHYHEPLGMVARRAAAVAERAHSILAPLLDHHPRTRTHIVITDDTDSANGSANSLPYNSMRLFVAAPEDLTPLGDYDDWLTELITHEYTHVLHLDTIGGIPAFLNMLIGKVYAPNHAQPHWVLEGLATFEETLHTSGGRLRSTMFQMFLRMDALEGRLLRLDQLSHSALRWPHGTSWYLYGSRFIQFIARRYGHRALTMMSHHYGRQSVPYGLNRIAIRATGKSFVELYDEFLNETRVQARALRTRVNEEGLVEGTRITHHGETVLSPRFLDANTIVYFTSDGRSHGQLRRIDARTGANAEEVVRVSGGSYLTIDRNRRAIVYSSNAPYRDIYFFGDLFRYNFERGERTRLTHGFRAQEPDLSPDGRRVAFTVNGAGTTHLLIADAGNVERTRRMLVRSRRYEQVFTPRFSPDGSKIAFSVWKRGGRRNIHVVDVATGEQTAITDTRSMDTGPAWSRDGRFLFFSSDRSGIANIYAYELASGALRRVTNVISGAYSPDVSEDGRLVYVGYTSYGFDLFTLPLDPSTFRDEGLQEDTRPTPSDTERYETLQSSAYNPLPTLWPHSYQLELVRDAFGYELGIIADGSDAVGFHSYAVRIGIGLERGNTNVDLSWWYERLPAPLRFRFFRYVTERGGLRVGGVSRRWIEEAYGGELGARYTFPGLFHSHSVAASYALTHLGKEQPFGGELDPNTPPPVLPDLGLLATGRVGWSYSDLERQTYDVSPSAGQAFTVAAAISDPILGSKFRTRSLTWSALKYIEMPWAEHHVLAMRYGGGLSGGDLGWRGVFSVGGYRSASILDAVIDNVSLGGIGLRGYRPFARSGVQFHLLQTEYRFPIAQFDRGIAMVPAYLERVHGTFFIDYGDAFQGAIDLGEFRVGVGGELLTEFTLGYYLNFTLRTGFARGLSEGGENQFYAHIGVPF